MFGNLISEENLLAAAAPETAALVKKVNIARDADQGGDLGKEYTRLGDAVRAGGQSFVGKIEEQMKDPAMKARIEELALKNPGKLADAVPGMAQNPNAMEQTIRELSGMDDNAALAAGRNANMEQMGAMAGAQEFLAHAGNSERWGAAYQALAGSGEADDPKAQAFADHVSQDPNYFEKLNALIENNPNAADTLADQIAGAPSHAQALGALGQAVPVEAAMSGMPAGLQGIFNMISGFLNGFIEKIMGALGMSSEVLGMDNKGGGLLREFANAAGFQGIMNQVDEKGVVNQLDLNAPEPKPDLAATMEQRPGMTPAMSMSPGGMMG